MTQIMAQVFQQYNDTVKGGSAKAANIAKRNEELSAAWNEFFKEDEQLNNIDILEDNNVVD